VTALMNRQQEVDAAFGDVNVGNANIYMTLKKDRNRTSVEFERALQPQLAAMADTRVSFQSQSGGFSGRDITIVIGGDDP
ncbi:hypothetical protein, partial [Salmonella enterica]|uniref:hypothetical protein n=1 Tax=Salmonella enterica TaxID=28901 RepID=UPI0020A3F5F2